MNTQIAALASQSSAEMTMTSVEIAKLTGKEHKHVLRDIRVMFEELEIGKSKFGQSYLDSQGRSRVVYNLPERRVQPLTHAAQLVAFTSPSVTTSASFEGCSYQPMRKTRRAYRDKILCARLSYFKLNGSFHK